MVPIISIVGRSDSGKTTLLERLIPELNRRGYRVGTVKHNVHGFDMDRPGKDTHRLKLAGARAVAISSPQKIAFVRDVDRELEIKDLVLHYLDDVDLVLTEGYKSGTCPKIEICKKDPSEGPLCREKGDGLFALIAEEPQYESVPHFRYEDVEGLADLLEERFLRQRRRDVLTLTVNGRYIPLKGFMQEYIRGILHGVVAGLKGGEGARTAMMRVCFEGDLFQGDAAEGGEGKRESGGGES